MLDFITNPSLFKLDPVFKIGFLILLGLYIIFAFMLLNKIRSFDRLITLPSGSGMVYVKTFAYLFLILLLFLFVLALVIV